MQYKRASWILSHSSILSSILHSTAIPMACWNLPSGIHLHHRVTISWILNLINSRIQGNGRMHYNTSLASSPLWSPITFHLSLWVHNDSNIFCKYDINQILKIKFNKIQSLYPRKLLYTEGWQITTQIHIFSGLLKIKQFLTWKRITCSL
jgi:hypothetical protein